MNEMHKKIPALKNYYRQVSLLGAAMIAGRNKCADCFELLTEYVRNSDDKVWLKGDNEVGWHVIERGEKE